MFLKLSCRQATFCLFIFIDFLSLSANPTSFRIPQFYPSTENILYEGDATMNSGNVVFNPQFEMDRVARCSYSEPFHLWDSTTPTRSLSNFTTNFTFMIDTNGDNYYSDGFAFFLAPFGYPIPPNSAAGDLGLFNSTNRLEASQNRIVHVEFDTRSGFWDPMRPHVGININSISSVVTDFWDFNVTRSKKVTSAQVTYNASDYNLTVFWTYNEATRYDNSLSFIVDLREVLPAKVAIGFSASTGFYPENLFISTWEFTSDLNSDDII
uniref:lectin beta-1 and beta-2 chains-like n=1 Tax=Fragaria vesca subsp. vesca TaxID=101020 RepID=UPI0005CAB4E8|nr:PREDICTED: lectin beta-1 and beta-2 chains-like [Fragaria vesca subsp. vesca]